LPEAITAEMKGNVVEHNYQWRGRRAAIIGGVIMLMLGVFLWKRKSISDRHGTESGNDQVTVDQEYLKEKGRINRA
jgi:hypothetical protein